ncbi:hypothetical protein M427DRAFT_68194 [Gonapodya prolifera JEL478]|uniref:Amino acid transporter transmembrane domain-containing protein n=1 Tax=Gonapodya prolifera (strain JEL478) TaxID=1344416 RepID=A0A139AM69_GONPJ|nr:hypothetical protein M427DRAFT_68194 [Gonapodya prolifera JEL478]|eukprot:KXS17664.1 hypothetical protein M427DRAFT_68194 [Gonapodya prolifera JEL478]
MPHQPAHTLPPTEDAPPSSVSPPPSSFPRSLSNTCNILIGVGILALPYALSISGWLLGLGSILALSAVTVFTAGLLGESMDIVARRRTVDVRTVGYADLAGEAFGGVGRAVVVVVFVTDLFISTVALVILMSDSLSALLLSLFPSPSSSPVPIHQLALPLPPWSLKLLCVAFLTPLTWLTSWKFLAWGSALGILSISTLVISLLSLFFALPASTSIGSIHAPAPTSLFPKSPWSVPLTTSIVMAGLAGHICLPTVYRQMSNRTHFPRLVVSSYIIVGSLYVAFAAVGYLMFGGATLPELTLNLTHPSIPPALSLLVLALFVVSPGTRFALLLDPACEVVEGWCGVGAGAGGSAGGLCRPCVGTEDERVDCQSTSTAGVEDVEGGTDGPRGSVLVEKEGKRERDRNRTITDGTVYVPEQQEQARDGSAEVDVDVEEDEDKDEDTSDTSTVRETTALLRSSSRSLSHSTTTPHLLHAPSTHTTRYFRSFPSILVRTLMAALVSVVAVLVPEFEKVTGVLGSALALTTAAVLPPLFYIRLSSDSLNESSRLKLASAWIVAIVGGVLAVTGTIAVGVA